MVMGMFFLSPKLKRVSPKSSISTTILNMSKSFSIAGLLQRNMRHVPKARAQEGSIVPRLTPYRCSIGHLPTDNHVHLFMNGSKYANRAFSHLLDSKRAFIKIPRPNLDTCLGYEHEWAGQCAANFYALDVLIYVTKPVCPYNALLFYSRNRRKNQPKS